MHYITDINDLESPSNAGLYYCNDCKDLIILF